MDVDFPVALRLKHGLQARPDIHLHLFTVRAGADAHLHRNCRRRDPPPLAAGALRSVHSTKCLHLTEADDMDETADKVDNLRLFDQLWRPRCLAIERAL